jgi:glycosyl transferase, family 25
MDLGNVYVINLDRDKHKWESVTKELDKYNIKYNKFSAIYGKDLTDEEISKNVNIFSRNFILNNGQIGCALSHIELLKQLVNDDDQDFYLILEDDLKIVDYDKILKIYNLYKNKTFDFEFLNLICYGNILVCNKFGKSFKYNDIEIEEKLFPLSTVGYFVTKKGAENFINKSNKILLPIDIQYNFFNNFYNTKTNLIETSIDISAIGDKNKLISLLLPQFRLSLTYPFITLFRKYEITCPVFYFYFFSLLFLILYFKFQRQFLIILFIIFLLLAFICSI